MEPTENIEGRQLPSLYPYERLSDLTNSQANKILKVCYKLLEDCQDDVNYDSLAAKLEINTDLFEDLIEIMKLKGWLEIEQ